jgi:hypothetical protein
VPEIKLPHDDPGAWQTFLFWLVHPGNDFLEDTVQDPILLVRCWYMGAKYGFDDFRDEAMYHLLGYFDQFESDGEVNKSVSTKLIQEAYCSGGQGKSRLKDLIAQEIAKSKLFHECNFDKMPHNVNTCELCRKDRANVREKLKCPRPAKKPHTNGCALESQLWGDVLEAKRVYREQKRGGYLFHRLEKDRQGKAPMWMKFLVSSKWAWVQSMFVDEHQS